VDVAAAGDDALAQFLIERYTAFTMRGGRTPMRFRIWHEPWRHVPLDVEVDDEALLDATGDWRRHACLVCGHHSAGLRDVQIGRPCKLCRMPSPLVRWTPLAVLPLAALALMPHVPAWAFMWAMAYAIFFGCKWATLIGAGEAVRRATLTRILAYLFAWPGMDAREFLAPASRATRPTGAEWLGAIAKPVMGVILLFAVAPHFADLPLLAGWIGMVGTILLLHFGVFHLLALALRRAGINVTPIMNGPLRSRSVGEFWGTRWNLGFHHLANELVFRPTVDRLGVAGALMLTFFASGLVHELVITLPARGGYGFPTLYFVLQGLGVLLERRIQRRRKLVRRAFALAVVGLPAFILFPPPFVLNVFVPFMRAIGAM
jgi:alginate O-acetyltransferase complex protein AlgI